MSSTSDKSGGKKDIWLQALNDPLAGATSASYNICLSDINGDGDYALILGDEKRSLRVWRGTSLVSQLTLIGTPSAVFSLYADATPPITPLVGVACGNTLFFYKSVSGNLRPKQKYELPSFDVNPDETKVWEDLTKGTLSLEEGLDKLDDLQLKGNIITPSAQRLLALENPTEQKALFEEIKAKGYSWRPSATCVAVLPHQSDAETAPANLVVGTEARRLMILNPATSKMLLSLNLPAVPALLSCDGVYTSDYRIAVGFRNGSIGIVRDGKLTPNVITTATGIVGLAMLAKRIYVARMDRLYQCFTLKGKCIFSIQLPSPVVCFQPMVIRSGQQFKAVCLGLQNGAVLVFNNKTIVSVSFIHSLCGMAFGSFGREEGTLVTTQKGGTLQIQLLRRQAKFDEGISSAQAMALASLGSAGKAAAAADDDDAPIAIPKRSSVYFDQMNAEVEGCQSMYRRFQRDLALMRLETSRSYVHLLGEGGGSVPTAGAGLISNFIQISAQVQGLGPKFNVVLIMSCVAKQILYDLYMTLNFNRSVLKVVNPMRFLPAMLPGATLVEVVPVECIDPSGAASDLTVLISSRHRTRPLVVSVVHMPASDPLDEQ